MKAKYLFFLLLVLVLVGGGFFVMTRNQTPTLESIGADGLVDSDVVVADSVDELPVSDRYLDYSPENLAAGHKSGTVVLFFHASWCPTCRAANLDITKNIDQIPDNLTILKTDYDTYTDLKKKYNVTYQHTFVEVDKKGELVHSWNGGGLDQILEEIN